MLWNAPLLLHLTQTHPIIFTLAAVFGSAAVSVIELTGSQSTVFGGEGDFNNDFNNDFNL